MRICMFDNNTGAEIPSIINTFPVDLILGNSVNEIHNNMNQCQLFCVFTHLNDYDFVVQNDSDKEILDSIIHFSGRPYSTSVKSSSIWYSKKAERHLIISDSVKLNEKDLSVILSLFLTQIESQRKSKSTKPVTMYFVINTRNSKEIIRTPNYNEAAIVCDKSPCTEICDRDGNVIYKSKFGKVAPRKTSHKREFANMKNIQNSSKFNFKIR